MFKEDLRQRYADDKRFAKSGSRPPIDCFVDRENRERRFMPFAPTGRTKAERARSRPRPVGDLKTWWAIPYGVRQVVRVGREIVPLFSI